MNNHEFMEAAHKRMAQCWATLMQKFNKMPENPALSFDISPTSRLAGEASFRSGKTYIRLNMGYVEKNAQGMIDRTVAHEVAHCWLYSMGDSSHVRIRAYGYRTRTSPHGYAFQNIMRILGSNESRCHNFEASDSTIAKRKEKYQFEYKCSCTTHNVSANIHNKICRGQKRTCCKCRQPVVRVT
jgi:SprT protein